MVGSKNFTEQVVLGELLSQLIERETGLAVEVTRLLERVSFSYPHGDVELSFYLCKCIGETAPRPPFRHRARPARTGDRFPAPGR